MKWITAVSLLLCISPALAGDAQDERQAATTRPATTRPAATSAAPGMAKANSADEKQVPITISNGHETDPRDGGRPVILIASALKVPAEVFRETFTHVRPAAGGRAPEPDQVRRNKEALMRGLSPYGVTNERLDTVSNFYRYSGSRGQMWRNTTASAYATVRNGVITSITVTNPGAGYSSEPRVSIASMEGVHLKATLSFGADFDRNGSIKEINVVPTATKAAPSAAASPVADR